MYGQMYGNMKLLIDRSDLFCSRVTGKFYLLQQQLFFFNLKKTMIMGDEILEQCCIACAQRKL